MWQAVYTVEPKPAKSATGYVVCVGESVFIKKNWFGLESSCKQARSPDILEILASLSAMAHSPDPGCSMVAPKQMLQAELKSFLSQEGFFIES